MKKGCRVSDLRDVRILVTGAAGVIGRETLRLLGVRGADVLSVDREALQDADLGGVRHLRLDLADDDLSELMSFDPHVVLHLAAAFERSKESLGFWPVNWHDNMVCAHRVVDLAAGLRNLRVFVFASSYLIYDPCLYIGDDSVRTATRLREIDPQSTRNVTGAAKLYTEAEVDFLEEYMNSEVRMVKPRIYRSYGCGSRDVVSRWIRAAISGEPVELYNGTNRFDYVFAGDVAEGLVRMAECDSAEGVINLATGAARSVHDLVAAVDREFPGFANRLDDRGGTDEYEHSCADVNHLRAVLGWVPPTTLEEGVAMIAAYERVKA